MEKVIKSGLLWILICSSMISTVLIYQCYVHKNARPALTFIGHASVKLTSASGKVIYIDPYFPVGDYGAPADFILITHGHSDHNNPSLCRQNKGCIVITWMDALVNGEYKTFKKDGIKIEAVPSGDNWNHSRQSCVGYIVTVDGISVYHAGDTSMSDCKYEIAKKKIDYAMYPVDGVYDMGPEEAGQVADLIGASHNIPIHGNGSNSEHQFDEFHANGKIRMKLGETIVLEGGE